MSIKRARFRRKVGQFLRAGKSVDEVHVLLPTAKVGSPGRTTIFVGAEGVDENGKKVRSGQRIKGRSSNEVTTFPMGEEKFARHLQWAKANK